MVSVIELLIQLEELIGSGHAECIIQDIRLKEDNIILTLDMGEEVVLEC